MVVCHFPSAFDPLIFLESNPHTVETLLATSCAAKTGDAASNGSYGKTSEAFRGGHWQSIGKESVRGIAKRERSREREASAAARLRIIEEPDPVSGAGSPTFVVCTTPVRERYSMGVARRFQQC